MNAGTNAMPMQSQPVAAVEIPLSRRIYWAVRREFWESRSIYLAPLGAAALFFVGFVVHSVHVPQEVRAAAALAPDKQHSVIAQPYELAGFLTMGVFLLVAMFYCVESLQRERRVVADESEQFEQHQSETVLIRLTPQIRSCLRLFRTHVQRSTRMTNRVS